MNQRLPLFRRRAERSVEVASGIELRLSRSIVARLGVNNRQIVVGAGVFRIHGDNFLEFPDCLWKLPALRKVEPNFEYGNFKIGIKGYASLEFRQRLVRF